MWISIPFKAAFASMSHIHHRLYTIAPKRSLRRNSNLSSDAPTCNSSHLDDAYTLSSSTPVTRSLAILQRAALQQLYSTNVAGKLTSTRPQTLKHPLTPDHGFHFSSSPHPLSYILLPTVRNRSTGSHRPTLQPVTRRIAATLTL
jgi:hypothetical protein